MSQKQATGAFTCAVCHCPRNKKPADFPYRVHSASTVTERSLGRWSRAQRAANASAPRAPPWTSSVMLTAAWSQSRHSFTRRASLYSRPAGHDDGCHATTGVMGVLRAVRV